MADEKVILNLDDNQDVAEIIDIVLRATAKKKDKPWEILTFTSPKQALEAISRQDRLDLVITNLMMPEFDGCEVTKRVKQKFPDCKVVIQSGGGSTEEIYGAGADVFLRAPFDPHEVTTMVERLLSD